MKSMNKTKDSTQPDTGSVKPIMSIFLEPPGCCEPTTLAIPSKLLSTIPDDKTHKKPKTNKSSENYLLIGFDTEYQAPHEAVSLETVKDGKAKYKVLSYQFHCMSNSGDEWYGIGCPEDGQRISLAEFLVFAIASGIEKGFLANGIPDRIYLAGHFTRADFPAFSNFQNLNGFLAAVRGTFVSIDNYLPIRFQTEHDDPVLLKVLLRDTLLLAPGGSGSKSLSAIGELVGVPKLSLHDDPLVEREMKRNMETFRDNNWDLYKQYAINDATICVKYLKELISLNHEVTGKRKVPTTLTSIGVDLLLKKWKADGHCKLEMLGREQHVEEYWSNKRNKWVRQKTEVPLQECYYDLTLATECFHGGRNEQFWSGPGYDDNWTDFDLTSAYPTAMSLIGKPDWKNIRRSDNVDEFTPTTLGMAWIEFSFPDHVRYPTLPVRTPHGLLFPRKGQSNCAAPEIFLARALGAEVKILRGVIVPTDPQVPVFQNFTKECIGERRKHPKKSLKAMFWKELANSTYGKTAQGLRPKRTYDLRDKDMKPLPESEITNPYYAAFITSFVRALLGELMNSIPIDRMIFSCTTDGFITDAPYEEIRAVTDGPIAEVCRRARFQLTGERTILERKHEVRVPLGWATRGQATLVPGQASADDPSYNLVLAKGGISVPSHLADVGEDNHYIVQLFLNRYPDQVITVNALTGIRDIVEHSADLVTKHVQKTLNMEFDWKRKPRAVAVHPFYHHISFSTVPWDSVEDFLRTRAEWKGFRKAKPICLKTIRDYEAFASYLNAKTLLSLCGGAAYVPTDGKPDLVILRRSLCSAWRQSQAGFVWERGMAQKFADVLSQCGIAASRYHVEYGNKRAFVPRECPPTEACQEALRKLKQHYPQLDKNELLADGSSNALLPMRANDPCPFIGKLMNTRKHPWRRAA